MKEDLLHYFWRTKKWSQFDLNTTDGEKIEIIYPGDYNTDQGPDFNYAKIKIGKTLWSGKIELHINTSDWIKHEHQYDSQYDNVILHVVYNHDHILRINNNPIPTLELKNYIKIEELNRYKNLIENFDLIPCYSQIEYVPSAIIISELEDASINRLKLKIESITNEVKLLEQDWDEILYRMLGRYLLGPVNKAPMFQLSEVLPLKIIRKVRDNTISVEAVLLGSAGFLCEKSKDTHILNLQNSFQHLQAKFQIIPMKIENWYFSRLRPQSFPPIRLAQLSALLCNERFDFHSILYVHDYKVLYSLFNCEASEYWSNHYSISEQTHSKINSSIGKSTIDILMINVIIPLLYVYGQHNFQEDISQKAVRWLELITAERNKFTKIFTDKKIKIDNARLSQGCIQLIQGKCNYKKCLQCKIGFSIFNNK